MEEPSSPLDNKTEEKENSDYDYDPAHLPDMLKIYYKRLFPHKAFYRWLSYASCKLDLNIKYIYKTYKDLNYN